MSVCHGALDVEGLAALERHGELRPWRFRRRAMGAHDIALDVLYCGVCHSDLHAIGEWGQEYPLVPGHEIVGRVTGRGAAVRNVEPGDVVAIGTIVDACRVCEPCIDYQESYCHAYPTTTYDGIDRVDGSRTRGGYSSSYVADQRFVHRVPTGLDLAGVAPLLCAGITTYSPLRHWQAGPGKTIGIVGIGGLGHVALKFARAMGAHVVAFTTSPAKADDAVRLGAHDVVVSTNETEMAKQANRFDFLLDTVSADFDMSPYLNALKLGGVLCSVGLRNKFDFAPFTLAVRRRSVASSGAGGTRETAEMLAFCLEHDIVADVELVAPPNVNAALERLARGDVRYRFVLDMGART